MAGEVRNVIGQLNRRKAVGAENITAEILRQRKNCTALLITDILNDGHYNNEMDNEWIQGIVTFIRRNKAPRDLGNYRPIALLNATYIKYGHASSGTD